MSTDADVDTMMAKLERVSPQLVTAISQAVEDVKITMHFAASSGVTRTIYFHPLFMIRNPSHYYDGLCFEVARRQQPKKTDILATGGR